MLTVAVGWTVAVGSWGDFYYKIAPWLGNVLLAVAVGWADAVGSCVF